MIHECGLWRSPDSHETMNPGCSTVGGVASSHYLPVRAFSFDLPRLSHGKPVQTCTTKQARHFSFRTHGDFRVNNSTFIRSQHTHPPLGRSLVCVFPWDLLRNICPTPRECRLAGRRCHSHFPDSRNSMPDLQCYLPHLRMSLPQGQDEALDSLPSNS